MSMLSTNMAFICQMRELNENTSTAEHTRVSVLQCRCTRAVFKNKIGTLMRVRAVLQRTRDRSLGERRMSEYHQTDRRWRFENWKQWRYAFGRLWIARVRHIALPFRTFKNACKVLTYRHWIFLIGCVVELPYGLAGFSHS